VCVCVCVCVCVGGFVSVCVLHFMFILLNILMKRILSWKHVGECHKGNIR